MKKITFGLLAFFLLSTMTISAQTVLINFCQDTYLMSGSWNNVTITNSTPLVKMDTLSTIIDGSGQATNLKLKVRDAFDGFNNSGYTSTSGDVSTLGFTGNASKSMLYIMGATGQAIVRIWGLDVNKVYSFSFYAGHQYPNGEVRSGRLTATGQNTAKDSLDAALNSSIVKTISNIIPTTEGYIDLTLVAATNNTNSTKYAYLAALQIVGTTPITTNIRNNNTTILSARLTDNNLIVGDYTGIVKVYTVNGKLVANGQSVFGYMPLTLQKGIYIVDTTAGKTKLVVK